MTLEDFSEIRKRIKDEGKKLVFTNGCFDIIHRGHIEYLIQAKSLGDYLIVAINSDESVRKIKGSSRPINNEEDRMYVLENLKPVDFVIIFKEDTPYEIIKNIMPDILVKGGDWKVDDIVGSDIVNANGGKTLSLKYVKDYSTTNVIRKLNELNQQNECPK